MLPDIGRYDAEKEQQMDNDDQQVGRLLTRREVLKLLGATSASFLLGCRPGAPGTGTTTTPAAATATPGIEGQTVAAVTTAPTVQAELTAEMATAETSNLTAVPDCVVRPELTEGPYFVDTQLNRSDIRSDPASGAVSEGALLSLAFIVSQVGNNTCTPLQGAVVDVWHCDAQGVYSGVFDPGFDTSAQQFLRGYQVTDAGGRAQFTTIYPGWYPGRTVHIHFKVRTSATAGQAYEFTSQLFFDEALNDQVLAQPPYAVRGRRNTFNSEDNIYNDLLRLNVSPTTEGYAATFNIGLDL
jgi:protocatechuate 3,4-dioxygenase beta subunit